MCEKLFALCQLQLGSIVNDLEVSVEGVNAAAARMVQGFKQYKGMNKADAKSLAEADLTETVGAEVKNIIMGLQFHDELNQRLQHVQTLLRLLEEQPAEATQQLDTETLLGKLTGIFSSNAEFNQLRKVFPGCHVVSSAESVELF